MKREKCSLCFLLFFINVLGRVSSQRIKGLSDVPVQEVCDGDQSVELSCAVHIFDPGAFLQFTITNFKWFRDGKLIQDARDGSYTIGYVNVSEEYKYTCEAGWQKRRLMRFPGWSTTDKFVTKMNDSAPLRVAPKKPVVNGMSQLIEGDSTSLTCASPSLLPGEPGYEWFRDGEPIAGANGSVYTVDDLRASEKQNYTCRITFRGVPSEISSILTVKVRGLPDDCRNGTGKNGSSATNPFCKFYQEKISDENAASVVENLEKATVQVTNMTKTDVTMVADQLEYITDMVNSLTSQMAQGLLNLASNVSKQSAQLDLANDNVTNSMIKSLEGMNSKIDLTNASDGRVRLLSKSMALEVLNASTVRDLAIMSSRNEVGLRLKTELNGTTSTLKEDNLVPINGTPEATSLEETDVAIQLPASLLAKVASDHAQEDVRLSMNVLTDDLFAHGSYELEDKTTQMMDLVLNSKIISATVTVNNKPVTDLEAYSSKVKSVFSPNKRLKHLSDEEPASVSICVFWDVEKLGGMGAWSDRGCTLVTNMGRDICECNHLSHFSVLTKKEERSWTQHDFYLSLITKAGLALSLLGLAGIILSFLAIREWRRGRVQQILFNMALSMFFAWSVFLAGFEQVEEDVVCKVVAAMLHYFILVSFCWMLVEGLFQFWQLVQGRKCYLRLFWIRVVVPAWGLPAVPVIVIIVIDDNLYLGDDSYCWMGLSASYYAFLLPISLILLVNLIIYILVIIKLCRLRDHMLVPSGMDGSVLSVRVSVCSFFILGLSWIMAVVSVKQTGVVLDYLFTVSTSLQGLLLFLLFVARDHRVTSFWKRKFRSLRTKLCGEPVQARSKEDKFEMVCQELHAVLKAPSPIARASDEQ